MVVGRMVLERLCGEFEKLQIDSITRLCAQECTYSILKNTSDYLYLWKVRVLWSFLKIFYDNANLRKAT